MAEPYQSLYRRYRPQRFSEVRGQDHVTLALRNSVRAGTVNHAYLFSGPRGTGKTSSARILAKALNCLAPEDGEPCGRCESCVAVAAGSSLDVHELDAASNNGVDAMRELVSRAALGTPGRWKVYIIDEVHMLSAAASNALLKTLEEPPGHVIFVLATTDPQKVLDTIKSRTQHFEFRLLGGQVLSGLLSDVSRDAGLGLPQEALDLALRRGHGSARDALSFLDQVAAAGVVDDEAEAVDQLIEALVEGDARAVLQAVAEACASGRDPQRLGNELIAQLRNGFLATLAPDLVALPDEARDRAAQQAGRLGTPALVRIMEKVGLALVNMREALDPRVALEVVLVGLARADTDSSVEGLADRVARLEHRLEAGGAPASAASPQAATPSVAGLPIAAAPPPNRAPSAGAREALGALRNRPGTGRPAGPPRAPAGPAPSQKTPSHPTPAPPTPARVASAPDRPDETGPTDAGPGGPGQDEIVQAWGDGLLASLPGRPRARYGTGRFAAVEGREVTFAVPNEAHRRFCEECRPEVEAALSTHFGTSLQLKLVVEPEAGGPAPGPDEPEEEIDLSELTQAPPVELVTPEERLMRAFPGSEEVG
ncbi:MAG: DNA polymerase III subunit gamma/tau [Acidimicrobiales bacterium]